MLKTGFNYWRGIVGASITAVICAAVVSSRSTDPLPAFLEVLVVAAVGATIGILVVVAARSPAGPPDALGFVYGGFWIRFGAYLVDVLTIGIPVAVLTAMNPSLIVLAYVVLPVYFVASWATTGQTFGMMLCGLRVVRGTDGGRVSPAGAILRLAGMIVAAIPLELGLIWAAFDGRKRGWHDMIAGTVVIREIG